MMDSKATLITLALLASAAVGAADSVLSNQPTALFDCLDESGYGRFSGKVQSLLMHRDYDNGADGTSGTVALTLNYLSPDLNGFSLGGQFVGSTRLFESGGWDNPAYKLHNDEFYVLNEGYLAYDFGRIGWEGTQLKVGRQIVNYDFAPTYNIRQKDQAFEAAILKLEPVDGLRIDLGHLERFSSWSSRRSGSSSDWQADFVDVEDRAGNSRASSGFQFVSAVYDGCKPWSFALYDFYGSDLYNTFGAKASYKWDLGADAGALTFRTHYANQQDVGGWDDMRADIDSDVWELAVDWSRDGLTLSAGAVLVNGDDFQTPFRTSFTIDTELLWYTQQFLGETDSGFLKAVYKTDKWLFYAMYVLADHDDGGSSSTNQEIDGVIKYSFNDHLYTTVKAGWGERDYSDGRDDRDAIDLRWFLGWTF